MGVEFRLSRVSRGGETASDGVTCWRQRIWRQRVPDKGNATNQVHRQHEGHSRVQGLKRKINWMASRMCPRRKTPRAWYPPVLASTSEFGGQHMDCGSILSQRFPRGPKRHEPPSRVLVTEFQYSNANRERDR